MKNITKIKVVFLFISLMLIGIACTKDKEKITVFIVGDSTVKNGRDDGATGLWGWGNPIKYHLDSTKINVENHALGGTSSRSFRDMGLWLPVLKNIKPGDYVLIQFGHNDGGSYNTFRARASIKGTGNDSIRVYMEHKRRWEYVHTYGWYLRKYINETKAKGGIPIIVTPIPRNDWNEEGNKIVQDSVSYPQWAMQIAKEEGVDYIDLNTKMVTELEKHNESQVTGTYFFKRDHTHTTAKGAILNAKLVAKGLLELQNCELSKYVDEDPEYVFPKKIRIVIIGDSTVAKGKDGIQGWGELLYKYFDDERVEIYNRARGGRSSRSFDFEGLWDKALELLRPGDYLFIQFGHNDGGNIDKPKYRGSLQGMGNDSVVVERDSVTEVVHTYGWYMTKYVKEALQKGAIPMVFSPIPRREWDGDKIKSTSADYQEWSKEVATNEGTYFVDLHDITAAKYEEIGKKKVGKEFFLTDHTHTTPAGAELNAQSVVDGIRKSGSKLANYLTYEK